MFGLYDTGGKIAGFIFDDEHLTSGQLAIIGGDTPLVKVWGDQSTLYNYAQLYYNSDSDWGLKGEYNSNVVFQLGSTNQIAGWAFDNEKLSKTDVRLEASSSFQGLGVSPYKGYWTAGIYYAVGNMVYRSGYGNYKCITAHTSTSTFDASKWAAISTIINDFVKIGDFADTTIPTSYSEDKSIAIFGYSSGTTYHRGKFELTDDFANRTNTQWIGYTTGSWEALYDSALPQYVGFTRTTAQKYSGSYSLVNLTTTNSSYENSGLIRIVRNVTSYRGQTLDISFWGRHNGVSDSENKRITDIVVKIGFSNTGSYVAHDSYSLSSDFTSTGWTQKRLQVLVPSDATFLYLYVNYIIETGSVSNSVIANQFYLDDFEIQTYPELITYINRNMIASVNSPLSYFAFTKSGLEIGANSIKIGGYNVPKFRKIADSTYANFEPGDIYEDTSGNIYIIKQDGTSKQIG
jgi:hypothetical protein